MGDGKPSVLSPGEQDPVPQPGERSALTSWRIATFALGGEQGASGCPNTTHLSAGTRWAAGSFCIWKASAVRRKKKKYFSPVLDFPPFNQPEDPSPALQRMGRWLTTEWEQLLPENLLEASKP